MNAALVHDLARLMNDPNVLTISFRKRPRPLVVVATQKPMQPGTFSPTSYDSTEILYVLHDGPG